METSESYRLKSQQGIQLELSSLSQKQVYSTLYQTVQIDSAGSWNIGLWMPMLSLMPLKFTSMRISQLIFLKLQQNLIC